MKDKIGMATFSELLRVAMGKRSQNIFSNEINISKEHLSRLINEKSNSVPSPGTLRNIAKASEGRVSYIELLIAANYLNDKDLYDYQPDNIPTQPNSESKIVTATLMAALSDVQMEWTIKNSTDFDLIIEQPPNNSKWFFLCSFNTRSSSIRLQLQSNYFQIIKTQAEPIDKFSFVTASTEEYITFCKLLPSNLLINLSVILIDPKKLEIQEETVLITNSKSTIPFPSFIK